MSLLQWMVGSPKKTPTRAGRGAQSPAFQASTQFVSSQNSGGSGASSAVQRKELLRVVLREMLIANGIPLPWIAADALTATSAGRPAGTHIRLLIKHWDPRLAHHGMGLQQDLEKRLLTLDPMASSWLMGISWQYALPDGVACPPLPHPDTWLDAPDEKPVVADASPLIQPIVTRKAGQASADARADLERLLAVRDADMQRHAGAPGGSFAPTEPSPL